MPFSVKGSTGTTSTASRTSRKVDSPIKTSPAGAAWPGIKAIYVAGANAPTHYVDVGASIDLGVASLLEHRVYIDGLGRDFDPDDFLRSMAGYAGMAVVLLLAKWFTVSGDPETKP